MKPITPGWPGRSLPADVLQVDDLYAPEGHLVFRVSRYYSADGTRWVFHGPFMMFHPNGRVATEGQYVDGLESGSWTIYHDTGRTAAEGTYCNGAEHGYWCYWNRDGIEQNPVEYDDGVPVVPEMIPMDLPNVIEGLPPRANGTPNA